MPFPTSAANSIINKILRNTDFSPSASLYLALFTADPGDTGASGEVTGGSYSRKLITFDAAADKHTQNSAAITVDSMPACTVSHIGIFSLESGGTFWWGGALTVSKTLSAGDSIKFDIGEIDINLT